MNEITIHGNLTANPVVNTNQDTGRSATTFDVAVNSRYYDRTTDQWRDRPAVFHKVVCFGELGVNAAETLCKGVTVTVTGAFADDTYRPDADRVIRRVRLEAADVAVSLRFAQAEVHRAERLRSQVAQVEPAAEQATSRSEEEPADPPGDETVEPQAARSRRGSRRANREPAAA
jgi:single-strand DNA-binding protein